MANKTINQLTGAPGALALTTEFETQVAGGASQKAPLSKVVLLTGAEVTAFAKKFDCALGLIVNGGAGVFNADGSGELASGAINWIADGSMGIGGGSANFNAAGDGNIAAGAITFDAAGNLRSPSWQNGDATIVMREDGSAEFAGGFASISTAGAAAFGNGTFSIDDAGNAGCASLNSASDIEVLTGGSGVILKSPGGNRFRIIVDDAGNVGTTPA